MDFISCPNHGKIRDGSFIVFERFDALTFFLVERKKKEKKSGDAITTTQR